MSLFGHFTNCEIKCPKSQSLAALIPNHTLKRKKNAIFWSDENDCWLKIIKGEKWVKIFRRGAAMVTIIVENT